jgi:hypothetical protein
MTKEEIAKYPNLKLVDLKPAPPFDIAKASPIK